MKYLLQKDKKRRIFFNKQELKRLILKALLKDKRLTLSFRLLVKIMLTRMSKNGSRTRIKNRCIFTGRGRGVFSYFRMSRLQVRDFYLRGLLYGVRKSSW